MSKLPRRPSLFLLPRASHSVDTMPAERPRLRSNFHFFASGKTHLRLATKERGTRTLRLGGFHCCLLRVSGYGDAKGT